MFDSDQKNEQRCGVVLRAPASQLVDQDLIPLSNHSKTIRSAYKFPAWSLVIGVMWRVTYKATHKIFDRN